MRDMTHGHTTLAGGEVIAGETVPIDAAQGVAEPQNRSPSEYRSASSNDSRVFFTSRNDLTAGATASEQQSGLGEGLGDLYVFEVTSGADEPLAGKLTDLTVDSNAGETAAVHGVIEASEDGSYVYFVANGVLGNGAAHGATPGDCEDGLARRRRATSMWSTTVAANGKRRCSSPRSPIAIARIGMTAFSLR